LRPNPPLLAGAFLCIASFAASDPVLVDFESPYLGEALRVVQDPFVAPGVAFEVIPEAESGAVVGLVKNWATSACVEPWSDNQKLGTGHVDFGADGDIGHSGYPIQVRFDPLLVANGGEVFVEVQFQVLRATTIHMDLLDDHGALVGGNERVADHQGGTCGNPGNQRARVTLTSHCKGPVRIARLRTTPGNRVFVIDDFRFGVVPVGVQEATWGRIKSLYLP
jgi:hypothetical protein